MPGNLSDYDFKIYYGPEDDRLRDFYIPALSRSIQYDRTAGFFSSSALAIAAAGVIRLIEHGGTMRPFRFHDPRGRIKAAQINRWLTGMEH